MPPRSSVAAWVASSVPPRNVYTGHQVHLEQLAEQIDSGLPDYRVAESSLAALELCEAAYLSAEHGCLVANSLRCERELRFVIVRTPASQSERAVA